MTFAITPENVTRVVLDNGAVVLVKENPTNASVSLRGYVRGGAMYELEAQGGLAQFTAGALVRGTRKYNFRKLNELFDQAGMRLSVSANTEVASFGGKALSEDFEALLDIAEQVLCYPTFPEKEVQALKGQLITSLREAEDDTRYVAWKKFRELLFPGGHPYHKVSDGTEKTVRRITRKNLSDFHARYYRPDGAIFVVVGDISTARAVELIERRFGRWRGARAIPFAIADAPPPMRAVREDIALAGKIQADIVMGFAGIRRSDPDYYALRIGDMVFGQLGLYGRLGEIVRDKMGLCYYIYSGIDPGIGAGPWAIGAGVNPRNVDQTIEAVGDQVRLLQADGVTDDELAHAQDYLTGSLALRLETNDGVAGTLADMELHGLGLDYILRYEGLFRGVTREQIEAVVNKYARLENVVTVVAGPAPALAPPGGTL
jgi:zinc protease